MSEMRHCDICGLKSDPWRICVTCTAQKCSCLEMEIDEWGFIIRVPHHGCEIHNERMLS